MIDRSQDDGARRQAANRLKPILEQVAAAGRDIRGFAEFAAKKLGDATPALRAFLDDARAGRIDVQGLSEAARTRLLGQRVDAAQRAEMIRTAAYFRAERRGFAEGHAEEDWLAAEQEIDTQLAKEDGLLQKGYRTLSSAATVAEHEVVQLRQTVAEWLGHRGAGTDKR